MRMRAIGRIGRIGMAMAMVWSGSWIMRIDAFAGVIKPLFRVAVVGGGPSGACAAEALTKCPQIETVLIERKMNNAKPCGGAIPLCMIEEFSIPLDIIDRKVRRMKVISPSNKEADIGDTLAPHEFIGMTRREILDGFLRDRAIAQGAQPLAGLVTDIDVPAEPDGKYVIHYTTTTTTTTTAAEGSIIGSNNTTSSSASPAAVRGSLEVDYIIGADGANSRVAKAMDAGEYNYAVAYQERIRLPDDKMKFYEDLAEMYVGDDISPDFYGWVFPKYDHVGVGTGTVVNRPAIKQYQTGLLERCKEKLAGGKTIKIEAHPIPEHMRPRRVVDRAALVGDAAGYVTKCAGEGIYFAAKSGRMAGQAVAKMVQETGRLPTQQQMIKEYIKPYDRLYGPTYTVLDVLQRLFFNTNGAREAFVELCRNEYVQRVTFDSYLYKKIQGSRPLQDIKLFFQTIWALIKGYATAKPDAPFSNPIESKKRL